VRLAEARAREDTPEDTGRRRGLRGRGRGEGGRPPVLDLGLHDVDGYSRGDPEEQGEKGPGGGSWERTFGGVIVCDGWKSYPSFTDLIQRCWAHLLREADWLAERLEEAKPLAEALHRVYDGLSRWFVDKPPPEAAALLAGEARREMEAWAGRGYGRVWCSGGSWAVSGMVRASVSTGR